MLCSCKKHGLSCVAACKNCMGQQCINADKTPSPASVIPDEDDVDCDNVFDMQEIIPEDCLNYDIPWLDEEVVEVEVPSSANDLIKYPWLAEDIDE